MIQSWRGAVLADTIRAISVKDNLVFEPCTTSKWAHIDVATTETSPSSEDDAGRERRQSPCQQKGAKGQKVLPKYNRTVPRKVSRPGARCESERSARCWQQKHKCTRAVSPKQQAAHVTDASCTLQHHQRYQHDRRGHADARPVPRRRSTSSSKRRRSERTQRHSVITERRLLVRCASWMAAESGSDRR